MEKIEDLLEKIKRGEVNITKLAKETGIPATRMYKWKDRDSDISLSDAKKLALWGKLDLDKSLNSDEEEENKDKTIADLAYSTRRLTDNNTELVEMQRQLLNKYVFSSHGTGKASQPLRPKSKVKQNPVHKEEFLGKSKTRLKVVPDQQKDSVKNEGK